MLLRASGTYTVRRERKRKAAEITAKTFSIQEKNVFREGGTLS